MSLYRFIDTWKAEFGTGRLCRVTGVPASSYYDWNHHGRQIAAARDAADAEVVAAIRRVHDESTETYGSPRVHVALTNGGVSISQRRIARLMRERGIVGLSGREHSTTTTRRDRIEAPFPDLVGRRFCPPGRDLVWYGDITYIWVENRFWYLATVIDAGTKEVLGWSFADHMRTSSPPTRCTVRSGAVAVLFPRV